MPASTQPRILVVGASAAGLKAAARVRRLLPSAPVTVVEEREVFSYAACGLPYFLSGDIDDLGSLRRTGWGAMRDAAFFARAKGIEVLTGLRAVGLDPERRVVVAADAAGTERELLYDRLVLATGAAPVVPAGVEIGGPVGTFHVAEDALALRRDLQAGGIGSAVIVGGGFIGCELAVAFAELWGCETAILEAESSPLPRLLDPEMGAVVTAALAGGGVAVHTGCPVTSARAEDGQAVVEAGGRTWRADRAIVAVGVRPRVDWLAGSGLRLGPLGGIAVDKRLRTSLPDVWAAGDCIEVLHAATGRPCLLPLGSVANRQGRVAAEGMAGRPARFGPVAGCSAVKVFATDVAAAGLTEDEARRNELAVRSVWGTFDDRPHYFPEHGLLHLKLVYEEGTGRLLGLQAVGGGADKRVDVAAQVLRRGGGLADLLDIEHCYSPPYAPALDPLHGLAAAALNREELGALPLSPRADADGRLVVDLRTAEEAGADPAPAGAVHIPLEELRERAGELPPDRPLLLVCAMGPRSWEAARLLSARGWSDVVYLGGGMALRGAGAGP